MFLLASLTATNGPVTLFSSLNEETCRALEIQFAQQGPGGVKQEFWTTARESRCAVLLLKRPTPTQQNGNAQRPQTISYVRATKRRAVVSARPPRQLPTLARAELPIWPAVWTRPEPSQLQTVRDVERVEIKVEAPRAFDCPPPAVGWLGVTDNRADELTYRVVDFDGSPPEQRTGDPRTVPNFNELISFSASHPALVFDSLVPCFLQDAEQCGTKRMVGTFQVVGRLHDTAGPRGQSRWQLCIIPVGGETT